ncbi:hypothetical protein SDC9_196848 [bioreactor metagenome]|uniref:Uncharacterized protein n=1 Tax=bioreactor metagenome TaxID=1076179 RepID=A0A645IPQ9_9ZZZZ
MVGGDEVFNDFGQVVFLSQLNAIGYVADYNLCTLFVTEFFVRVDAARLVLGKENGVLHLSDIVVEGSGTYQLAFGTDAYGCFCRKVGYLQ